MTRFAEHSSPYGTHPYVTWFLDPQEVPSSSRPPDGRKRRDGRVRQNTDSLFCGNPASTHRPNRNFPSLWGCCGVSSGSALDTYAGRARLGDGTFPSRLPQVALPDYGTRG